MVIKNIKNIESVLRLFCLLEPSIWLSEVVLRCGMTLDAYRMENTGFQKRPY